ncbi:hypothetical protein M422DRAFT_774264 [Sphaerobolus stellatus SS14]|nr:hypothetical protein M422DRAFT_774264 [Sphaerobolus stellatus SS14]
MDRRRFSGLVATYDRSATYIIDPNPTQSFIFPAMDHDHDRTNDSDQPLDSDHNDGPHSTNDVNDNTNDQPEIQAETFIFSGAGGPAFLSAMQGILNRLVRNQPGQPLQPQPQAAQPQSEARPDSEDVEMHSDDDVPPLVPLTDAPNAASNASGSSSSSSTSRPSNSEPDHATNANPPPGSRPIRPLPRHVHAHTPVGIIDLFTFNITTTPINPSTPAAAAAPPPAAGGAQPQPGAPPAGPNGAATFTFNFGGTDLFAGLENFFLNGGMQLKEREPDFKRARTLLRGMEAIPVGLVRRLERAGGVPGAAKGGKDEEGQGDEHAGCAVCWGPLLEDIEPGEWDSEKQKEEKEAKKEKEAEGEAMNTDEDEDEEFRGRIVALPCAHVYHAECLLPWFARNTTCPTCRFDIDPESLTWTPPQPAPQPVPHRPAEPAPAPAPEPAANSNPNPSPQPTNTAGANANPDPVAERFRRANAAEAARFNNFIEAILQGMMPGAAGPQPQPQPQPQEAQAVQPQATSTNAADDIEGELEELMEYLSEYYETERAFLEPTSQEAPRPQTESQSTSSQSQPEQSRVFGPAPPPPPRPPVHAVPALFRMPMPLFFMGAGVGSRPGQQPQQPPTQPAASQPGAQAQEPGQQPQQPPHERPVVVPEAYISIPIPFSIPIPVPVATGAASQPSQPQAQPQPQQQRTQQFPPFPPFPSFPAFRRHQAQPDRPRRKWVPPDPIGKTLRQRVETKERELGIRCDDPICGLAPADDDDPATSEEHYHPATEKRIELHAAYDAMGRACEHKFHPACIVTSARVSGTRDSMPIIIPETRVLEKDQIEEVPERQHVDGEEILVPCPACRAEGWMWKEEWEEGVKAVEEEVM